MRELEAFQRLSSAPQETTSTHLAPLLMHFYHPGIDQDGEHLCLVMELLGCPVDQISRKSGVDWLPVPIVKRILRHLLLGIARLHECGIVHTGALHFIPS